MTNSISHSRRLISRAFVACVLLRAWPRRHTPRPVWLGCFAWHLVARV